MTRNMRRVYRRRRAILVLMVGVMLVLATIQGCRIINGKEPSPAAGSPPENPPSPPPPSPPQPPAPPKPELPGALIASIDNMSAARPQSGMDKADLVMEMIAEGGITRYLAFFYSKAANQIGPIRSARYYFVYIAKAFNTPFAHAGGSEKALSLLAELRVPDLDEIYNAGNAFWRDNSRKAPHNLYTSTDKMLAESARKNLTLTPLPKLLEGEVTQQGTGADNVALSYSPTYKVTWKWENDRYVRYINGQLHTMKDGAKLLADNVVIMSAAHRDVVTDTLRTDIDIIGSGSAKFLRDGRVYVGTWKKAGASDHFEFMVEGQPYKFKPGTTWIQVIHSMDAVLTGQ